jgi:hypothetical protein
VYTRRFSCSDLEKLGDILVDKYVESDDDEHFHFADDGEAS